MFHDWDMWKRSHHAPHSPDGRCQGWRGCQVTTESLRSIVCILTDISISRYTITYTPSLDRILPPPTQLHLKIKNTVSAPLRAAYLHGPYTLYVACYPSTFSPYKKHVNVHTEGAPAFEPQLKAGGHWTGTLKVPEEIREDAQRYSTDGRRWGQIRDDRRSFTWIVEIASQVIFSKTASVDYELLVGRDEKSVDLGFHGVIGSGHGAPGKLEDHQKARSKAVTQHPKGVFSKAIRMVVDDTDSLWNSPPFPEWEKDEHEQVEDDVERGPRRGDKRPADAKREEKRKKQKKIHLVLLTHGIHSNVGADMLFMKESIDAAARQAKEDAERRRAELRAQRMMKQNEFGREALDQRSKSVPENVIAGHHEASPPADDSEDDEEEEVYVRGFTGNTVKTEKGIQYLGKRFAKYVLSVTYPDQPYLPIKSSMGKSLSKSLSASMSKTSGPKDQGGTHPAHKNSSIIKDENHRSHNLPYRITSISFISHSLGGLIQTYAIAYIQKHSPEFFNLIQPVNFVALASPFLGLSNENPMYVKFALDFGLVGRTGQDLGLTWRAPTLAKSGWGAMVAGFTNESNKNNPDKESDPSTKPLLRILPTGPAHIALKKFWNRTVYSNVVNDGIVPLRTSCLLFLDWRGLGRVEKARRESGLVGTMVGWGLSEMLGHNASDPRKALNWNNLFSDSGEDVSRSGKSSPDPESKVPQAETSEGFDHDQRASEPEDNQFLEKETSPVASRTDVETTLSPSAAPNLWTEFLNFFKPQAGRRKSPPGSPPRSPKKTQKIYRRGQTMPHQQEETESEGPSREPSQDGDSTTDPRKGLVRGASLFTNNSRGSGGGEVEAPPKTTFFESAGDLLSPPLPPKDFILDPAARPRTIFHDRVYHPQDIPPPPTKRQRTFGIRRSASTLLSNSSSVPQLSSGPTGPESRPSSGHVPHPPSHVSQDQRHSQPHPQDFGTMRIEEKIARAYHKDLSWRKVLVRLEPDAHNNMVVRRMFANAYGWPVVQHICDTHFAFTAAARTRDEDEDNTERAVAQEELRVGENGGEKVRGQRDPPEEEEEEDRGNKRASTTDNVKIEEASPQDINVVHSDLQKLHANWKVRDRSPGTPGGRTKRTESEIREARDDVSELVSRVSATGESYSGMNSGKAALSRLHRQDSARWSDRFFDGSDDGDDDDEEAGGLDEEIRKARYRGELDRKFNIDFDVDSTASDSETGRPHTAKITDGPLTSSPDATRLNKPKAGKEADVIEGHIITDPEAPLSAEPAELEPFSFSSASTSSPKQTTADGGGDALEVKPGSITSLSTGAGLGLSLGENIVARRRRETRAGSVGDGGVAEQVALAATKSNEESREDS